MTFHTCPLALLSCVAFRLDIPSVAEKLFVKRPPPLTTLLAVKNFSESILSRTTFDNNSIRTGKVQVLNDSGGS